MRMRDNDEVERRDLCFQMCQWRRAVWRVVTIDQHIEAARELHERHVAFGDLEESASWNHRFVLRRLDFPVRRRSPRTIVVWPIGVPADRLFGVPLARYGNRF